MNLTAVRLGCGGAIKMIHIFVCYSRRDKAFISLFKIYTLDRAANINTHIDFNIREGEKWRDKLLSWIRVSDIFIYMLSPDSAISKECKWELDQAIKSGKSILPVLIRETDEEIVPQEVRDVQYTDFTQQLNDTILDNFLNSLQRLAVNIPIETIPSVTIESEEQLEDIEDAIEDYKQQRYEEKEAEQNAKIEEMTEWFFQNYEDPIHNMPYDSEDGDYIYIYGGPYEALEALHGEFRDIDENLIEQAADEINSHGWVWVPIHPPEGFVS